MAVQFQYKEFAKEDHRDFWLGLSMLSVATLCYMFNRRMIWEIKTLTGRNSKFKAVVPKDIKQNFSNVAGLKEAKTEIKEFVDFLRQPDKYIKLGARMPRGALLHGPPGTGKTLIGRACAKEANVPFFYASGSDFV